MENNSQVSFVSFLAGMLMVEPNISFVKISQKVNEYETENNVDVLDNDDNNLLFAVAYFDDKGVHLKSEYSDNIFLENGEVVNVYDYLYSLTNEDIIMYLINKFTSVKR